MEMKRIEIVIIIIIVQLFRMKICLNYYYYRKKKIKINNLYICKSAILEIVSYLCNNILYK